jgi:hypothetical protein
MSGQAVARPSPAGRRPVLVFDNETFGADEVVIGPVCTSEARSKNGKKGTASWHGFQPG